MSRINIVQMVSTLFANDRLTEKNVIQIKHSIITYL
jgi:hypothetical protein